MKENEKDNRKEKKFVTDANGDTWDEDGNYVENDNAHGSLMDRINRRSRGEDVPIPGAK